MANSTTSETIEALAAEIGESVYIDIAKWHLYLNDAHLHTVLAERLFPLVSSGTAIQEDDVLNIVQSILVKVGGGKREIPLLDLLPMQCQVSLIDTLEEFQRNL
ncbi:hypothetical protein NIES2135_17370 [Leptolyngbya boryana NIES-2135]|jgi:hypothetical protein|uniref:Thylakoid-associated protein n=1 Tax=Leptolyngbya boryana NIES-2135 TaxID=1973484 RepID=A0A1Z4JE14_LEPBY|nr:MULTISPECIES: DUF3181 family protein [Leptolyngbya]BAY54918.1 hypothetical protein NIES2135_17370 [Leptolyngbya boryana NIES-2135]MBD2365898.1 DUF3181 family protein [Leptolyngbya sp. FACHB-161]MBD2372078.1 DUF3181 family protein [Leptolyngbya sp. FACHB-238]MBD2396502.1 DUF3181 family protein [Leptolyngbya sp. FACHB-239]MBD2403024.1 DUF3181 family protein [Leptolyngbya sp. FACHB-402]